MTEDQRTPQAKTDDAGSSPVFGGAFQWIMDRSGLAVAPAIGYYLVFRYEAAYCSVFGVPTSLVQPNLTTILLFATVVFASGPLLLNVIDSFLWMQRRKDDDSAVTRVINMYTAPLCLLVFVLSFSQYNWGPFELVAWLIGITTGSDVVFALLDSDKPKRPFIFRLKGPFHWFSKTNTVGRVTQTWFGKYAIYVLLVYVSSFLAGVMGQSNARSQTIFPVLLAHPDSIVVRIYDNRAICVSIGPDSKKVLKQISVRPIDDKEFGVFEERNIGPLKFD